MPGYHMCGKGANVHVSLYHGYHNVLDRLLCFAMTRRQAIAIKHEIDAEGKLLPANLQPHIRCRSEFFTPGSTDRPIGTLEYFGPPCYLPSPSSAFQFAFSCTTLTVSVLLQ